jgi:hypothetical protein
VAECIFKMEPKTTASYIALSNIYAAAGHQICYDCDFVQPKQRPVPSESCFLSYSIAKALQGGWI